MSIQKEPLIIQENVPLAPFTTLGVGGPARYFAEASTADDVPAAMQFAEGKNLPIFVFSGGSNVIVADDGFAGLAMRIAIDGLDFESGPGREVIATVGAGVEWDRFVAEAASRGLAGIECLSGIPGSVGGTPVQNVGAYGQEVSETIVSVECFDRQCQAIVELPSNACGFGYRTSIFNTTERNRFIVLRVKFRLLEGGKPKIAYKDLENVFAGRDATLMEVREAVIAIRRAKSMVVDLRDPNSRSVGSFFKNLIVSPRKASELRALYPEIPLFPLGEDFKVPAAFLIEKAGFKKGFVYGQAGISENHTLAIINRGRATAAEILGLAKEIQNEVEKRFSLMLIPEPVLIGFGSQ